MKRWRGLVMVKSLFEKRIIARNKTKAEKEPEFGFCFVGETSPEAELNVQAKFLIALMDINALSVV